MTVEQSEELFLLRTAVRDIVDAIKDTKHLHKNLSQYIVSDNEHIRAEYNKLRVGLGSVLRRVEAGRADGADPAAILLMDVIKLEMEEHDRAVNGIIESLVRENQISAEMATSLMNDAGYSYDVARDLVQMGEVLFATGESDLRKAERSLLLDEDETSELVEMEKQEANS